MVPITRRDRPGADARTDAGTLLARALVADAARHGLAAGVRTWRSHPWASATFVGARHLATLTVEGDAGRWLAGLPDRDLPLRGHLVADLAALPIEAGLVTLEALTLLDG